ncbi:MAG: biotin--[acetyl-CoA-carboxylase] ligase [Deltaproteobacteria bacterium]|nr:biotin--[acetyl-CoA-carboxylase] ligase [Deltaproteobacteria bacterium]
MPDLVRLDEVDSTQRVARALIAEGAAHGTLVVARRQRAGRGRLQRAWHSDEGGLWLSMVVKGAVPAPNAPRLTLGAAVLALEALDALGARAALKWPNDLVLAHPTPVARLGPWRKLGGLLLEGVVLDGAVVRAAVLGMGINVRAPQGGFPADLTDLATSLEQGGVDVSVDQVLAALAPLLRMRLLDALDEHAFGAMLATARARSATLGMRVEVDGVTGRAESLADDGALCIRDEGGALHTVRAGDVQCMV